MSNGLKLFHHQTRALSETKGFSRCAYYLDMGLGKTFVGSEKADEFDEKIVVVCQKSKIQDWIDHFTEYYGYDVYDLTRDHVDFTLRKDKCVGIINYDLLWRRKGFKAMRDYTLVLDESSLIQNHTSKRTKFIMSMVPKNVILLSGTPTDGKYERLWTQCRLLGWNISKTEFWNRYVIWSLVDFSGIKVQQVVGYKNVDDLKENLRKYGCVFMKTDEVISLPEQVEQIIRVNTTPEYKKFMKNSIVTLGDGTQLVGDNSLTKLMYARELCGMYNDEKIKALCDLIDSTSDRVIIFYNFNGELEAMKKALKNRHISVINGNIKDLSNYEKYDDSVTLVQYQSGSYGLNLQKARRTVYYSLPLSSEMFEQSKKRIHRIGQNQTCFYYILACTNSVEMKILKTLRQRKDYTGKLFERDDLKGVN